MTLMAWLWIGLSILGAIVLAAVVWLAGPLISVGDAQPFDNVLVRLIIIVLIFLAVGGAIAWRILSRRRAAAKIAAAMTETVAEDSDAPVLKQKMEDALAVLKRSGKSNARALYDLPWYLIIGPPGAGKTTALVNSGLKFPLAGDNAAMAVQGVGGTRYCDWWFTDEAVLIDTAGRYTTQDSDAKADRRSWLAFLDMLSQNRPRQPINGVIVAISIADVLNLSAKEVAAHADAIRKRLDELHEELKVDFPVYAVFTKMDLVEGFTQYFADLDEAKRQAVWGATFQTDRQEGQQRRQGSGGDRPPHSAHFREDARTPAGGARPQVEGGPVRISGAARRHPKADRRLPQSRLRAHALPDDRDLARLLLHLGDAGGNAVRRRHRRAAKELRRAEPRQRRIFGRRARASSWRTS